MGLEIPSEFGYVILTGVSSAFVIMYKVILIPFFFDFSLIHFSNWKQGIQVGMARKKYGIKYPQMYATEEAKEDGKMFNCIQVKLEFMGFSIRIPDPHWMIILHYREHTRIPWKIILNSCSCWPLGDFPIRVLHPQPDWFTSLVELRLPKAIIRVRILYFYSIFRVSRIGTINPEYFKRTR